MMTTTSSKRLHVSLTEQECLILKAFALGVSCEKICRLLDISETSFQSTCASLYAKLEVENTFAAVQVAFQKKIFDPQRILPRKNKSPSVAIRC